MDEKKKAMQPKVCPKKIQTKSEKLYGRNHPKTTMKKLHSADDNLYVEKVQEDSVKSVSLGEYITVKVYGIFFNMWLLLHKNIQMTMKLNF